MAKRLKSKLFKHTVYSPFTGVSKNPVKINGRVNSDYVGLDKDLGPLGTKAHDPSRDDSPKPLEVCRNPKVKKIVSRNGYKDKIPKKQKPMWANFEDDILGSTNNPTSFYFSHKSA